MESFANLQKSSHNKNSNSSDLCLEMIYMKKIQMQEEKRSIEEREKAIEAIRRGNIILIINALYGVSI